MAGRLAWSAPLGPKNSLLNPAQPCYTLHNPAQDDMELAPDFFGYFAAAAPLLDADASLLCASSWNDHGQARLVRDAARLERSDFFPGLGWMLTAALWGELRCARPGAAPSPDAECPPERRSAGRTPLCVPPGMGSRSNLRVRDRTPHACTSWGESAGAPVLHCGACLDGVCDTMRPSVKEASTPACCYIHTLMAQHGLTGAVQRPVWPVYA
jgi:hypothetical protein